MQERTAFQPAAESFVSCSKALVTVDDARSKLGLMLPFPFPACDSTSPFASCETKLDFMFGIEDLSSLGSALPQRDDDNATLECSKVDKSFRGSEGQGDPDDADKCRLRLCVTGCESETKGQ
jgi:hypothetical protein